MRKKVCRQLKEALLCKGGIAESGLQMPHVHVLLVTPLGACDMAQAGTDKHQGRIAIGEGTHNSGAPADLAVQAFHDVVRADPRPGLNPKSCVNCKRGENRSEFNVCGSGFIRLPPCVQYNAGGDGCQGRRQGRRSSERRAAARRPLTSGPGGVIRACVRQNRWTAARGSRSSPAAVPSTFS